MGGASTSPAGLMDGHPSLARKWFLFLYHFYEEYCSLAPIHTLAWRGNDSLSDGEVHKVCKKLLHHFTF